MPRAPLQILEDRENSELTGPAPDAQGQTLIEPRSMRPGHFANGKQESRVEADINFGHGQNFRPEVSDLDLQLVLTGR